MPKSKQTKNTLADPTQLKTVDPKSGLFHVIIETPKGCRNKYAFDPDLKIFTLRKTLPAGMAFPYDFGFLPRTLGGDGDPLDVLVLMDEPAFAGCMVCCRIIGVIEGVQVEGKKRIRNDRFVAVAEANHEYANVKKLSDMPKRFLNELENFFVNYHRLEGKRFELLGTKGEAHALTLIQQGKKKSS